MVPSLPAPLAEIARAIGVDVRAEVHPTGAIIWTATARDDSGRGLRIVLPRELGAAIDRLAAMGVA